MTTSLPDISRIGCLKQMIDVIRGAPRAGNGEATMFATKLVASYAGHQWADETVAKVYFNQLADLLEGQDIDVLERMVSPRTGIVATCPFLPHISRVREWLDAKMDDKERQIEQHLTEIRSIEDKAEDLSPEERKDRRRKLLRVSQEIRETAAAMRMTRLEPPKPVAHPLKYLNRILDDREEHDIR